MLQSLDGSFCAWITIEGVVTPEYSVETSADGKTVTCWIASELGKKFAVHWTNRSYPAHIQGQVKMDGVNCGGRISYGHLRGLPKSSVKDGISDGMTVKPFVFSGLALSDDDALLGGPSYENLGLIELTLHPVQILNANVPCSGTANLSNLQVHERSKKAVTQQITLAAPIIQRTTFARTARLAADLVTFTFKYRPLDILQANGMAPASSGLKRKSSDEESSKSALSEHPNLPPTKRIVKKEKKPRVKEEEKTRVKSEDDVIDLTDERPSKRVKREGSNRRPFNSGEVIDLT